MVARDEDYGNFGQCFTQSLKLPERKHDGVVRGAYGMEEIARYHDRIGSSGDYAIDCVPESLRNVGFPLIYAARSLPVVLPDAEMGVRNVGQFHAWRMNPSELKSKQPRA